MWRLLTGELRQGALAGVMADAVAAAAHVPVADVRRAAMLGGDLGRAARVALEHGASGLADVGLAVLHPVQPMLAASATSVAEALAAHRSGIGRMEARRRPDPGAPPRTTTSASTPAT